MIKLLANDGIDASAEQSLTAAGITVLTQKIPQEDLVEFIQKENIIALTVRSATQVRQDIIDKCPSLKVIARGGVGMDNIDVQYAINKGLHVIYTPAASSQSVAELVFAHLTGAVRFLPLANREMPTRGNTDFASLKKQFSAGTELKGKKLGIVGFGRIGQAVAKIGLGLGMEILPVDENISELNLTLDIIGTKSPVIITLKTFSLSEVLPQADVITFHVPGGCIIDSPEIAKMKKGVILINTARGGVINEEALLQGLNEGIIAQAGLDVFVNEPKPDARLLSHPKISLTPHIGAATEEAQMRIGHELAAKLLEVLTPHLSHS